MLIIQGDPDYYDAAFDCLGDKWNPAADVTSFVNTHVSAQVKQVEALSLRQETERALWTILEDIVSEELGMDRRAVNALYDAFLGRSVSNEYYRRLTDIHVNTATNDLKRLAASGVIEGVGPECSTRSSARPCRGGTGGETQGPLDHRRLPGRGPTAHHAARLVRSVDALGRRMPRGRARRS